MKIIVYKAHADNYRWRLVDDEDNFVEHSELIATLEDCLGQAYKRANEEENTLEVENRVGVPSQVGDE